jgi:hypothetical protein
MLLTLHLDEMQLGIYEQKIGASVCKQASKLSCKLLIF